MGNRYTKLLDLILAFLSKIFKFDRKLREPEIKKMVDPIRKHAEETEKLAYAKEMEEFLKKVARAAGRTLELKGQLKAEGGGENSPIIRTAADDIVQEAAVETGLYETVNRIFAEPSLLEREAALELLKQAETKITAFADMAEKEITTLTRMVDDVGVYKTEQQVKAYEDEGAVDLAIIQLKHYFQGDDELSDRELEHKRELAEYTKTYQNSDLGMLLQDLVTSIINDDNAPAMTREQGLETLVRITKDYTPSELYVTIKGYRDDEGMSLDRLVAKYTQSYGLQARMKKTRKQKAARRGAKKTTRKRRRTNKKRMRRIAKKRKG